MDERCFNLLREPWIRVLTTECEIKELSLLEVLRDAHLYRDLSGELPTQNTAMLRFLLAILHTVFSRVDAEGRDAPIRTRDDALHRWRELWQCECLPEQPLAAYLTEWEDRFWLFDKDHPFYQAPGIEGTDYNAAKLNGQLSESRNKDKVKLFPVCSGETRKSLSYAEAARWLLCINSFDDSSGKKKDTDTRAALAATGRGWLGKIGPIEAVGNNLYETLLLNLTLLKDGDELWPGVNRPVWEQPTVKTAERTEIVMPDNPAELLTLQSRRLLLYREDERVTGFTLLGGDVFPEENAFAEQMTVWREVKAKGSAPSTYIPRRHDSSKQMWRDFAALTVQGENRHRPGVVAWLILLRSQKLLDRHSLIRFRITSAQYDEKNCSVTDVFSDSLSFHADLLTELGRMWQIMVTQEIELADQIANEVGYLAANIGKAAGGDGASGRQTAKEQFYHRLDVHFRDWLRSLDPDHDEDEREACRQAWRATLQRMALAQAGDMVAAAGDRALVGRTLTERYKGKEDTRHYSAPEAYNWFIYKINHLMKGS